jgi:hypothetical protein
VGGRPELVLPLQLTLPLQLSAAADFQSLHLPCGWSWGLRWLWGPGGAGRVPSTARRGGRLVRSGSNDFHVVR